LRWWDDAKREEERMTEVERYRLFKRAKYWECESLFDKIVKRDKACIYYALKFEPYNWAKASIEHIDNNEKNVILTNIAFCCRSCNSSKDKKKLNEWLKKPTRLVKEKNIEKQMVDWVKQKWLQNR
jgi:5-methylcytosine-specific restriction endonuclease McrA